MPLSHFPYGVSSFGIPVMGAGTSSPLTIPGTNGNVWFVDSVNGSNGNGGTDPSQAFGTITHALLVARAGDTIFVMVGTYNEAVVVTTDYIAIVGATWAGYGKPDVGPSTTGVPLTVTAQGFMCRHVRFAGNGADVVIQQGNGFAYSDCVFDGDATASKAGLRLLPSSTNTHLTASEGIITDCLFRGNAIGLAFDTGAAPVGVGSTDNLIAGNRFYTNTLDIATADAGTGTYSVQLTDVIGNYFADKNKATYVDLTTTNGGAASDQTGTFAQNGFASDTMTTTKIKAVGTGFTFMGNYDTVGIFDGSGLD